MKYLLITCFFAGFLGIMDAQNCGAYVNSSATGDPNVRTVAAYIPIDSTQGNPPTATAYIWNTGQTTNAFNVSVSGEYCVTVTFDNGCTASDCSYVTIIGVNCWANITQSGDLQSGFVISANSGATGGFNYLWNNGSTQQSITTFTTGNYCVTATNVNTGCIADTCLTLFWDSTACTVNIYNNWQNQLIANAQGVYPVAYLWGNGSTDQSIPLPTAPGDYCVTTTDATGCSTTACYTVTSGGGGNPNCVVYLSQNKSTGSVYANTPGAQTDIIHYQWSDPTLPDTIIVFPGFDWDSLCVTVTNTTNGCISTQCIANEYKDLCLWSINRIRINSTSIALVPFGAYGTNATYLWSNGATTDTLIVTQPGTYTVTVNGTCTAVDSLTFEWTNDLRLFMFNAPATSSIPANFQAWAIQHDPAQGGILTPIAESLSDSDIFRCVFDDLPNGEYLFKAACMPGSPGYLTRMPTYYKSSLWWDQAQTIQIPSLIRSWSGHYREIGIDFIEGQNPGGPGFVGGLVSEGANFTNGGGAENSGAPLYPASVLIYDLAGNLVAGVSTAADGQFSIPNLPYGTYKLIVEAAGITPYETWITLSATQPTVQLEIEVKVTTSAVLDRPALQGFNYWPNPTTNGQITVEMPAEGQIVLKNAQGQTLRNIVLKSGQTLVSLQDLPPAVYFLEAQTAIGNVMKKIVVE